MKVLIAAVVVSLVNVFHNSFHQSRVGRNESCLHILATVRELYLPSRYYELMTGFKASSMYDQCISIKRPYL